MEQGQSSVIIMFLLDILIVGLQTSQLCLDTLVKVLRNDLTGTASLEVVRLLNRMIKEKRFNVNPAVLSCLLHLRLKSELGVRASETKADKESRPPVKMRSKGKDAARRSKGKAADQPHLSKKALKALKERKEIEREFRDAEAEIDKEERATTVSPSFWFSRFWTTLNRRRLIIAY